MEHLSHGLQVASLGGVGVLLVQPDSAHLALLGIVVTTAGSIITAAINRRSEKESREFQAHLLREAFLAAATARYSATAPPANSTVSSTALDGLPPRSD